MGVREILLNEVVQDRPDTSYLATGIKENLVTLMRGSQQVNSGFTWLQVLPATTHYDLNGSATLSGGAAAQLLYTRELVVLSAGVTQFFVKLFGAASVKDPLVGFRVELYKAPTTYNFNAVNLNPTNQVIELACSGLPSTGGYYRVRVFARRNSSLLPSVDFILRQFSISIYPSN